MMSGAYKFYEENESKARKQSDEDYSIMWSGQGRPL